MRAVEANHLVRHGKVHKVPHLSLYGNAHVPVSKMPELRRRIAKICGKYSTLPYLVDGYDSRVSDEGRVVAFRIIPSAGLLSFRRELVRSLHEDFPSEKPWDSPHESEPWFHIAIAYKLPDNEFRRVWEYLNENSSDGVSELVQPRHVSKVRPYLPLEGLRVTILSNGGRIDREYDLAEQRFLSRDQALDWRHWCSTYRAFRAQTGIDLKRSGLFQRLIRQSRKTERYFISDLHLDHGNIVRYCARPFCKDVREMNRVLINNWNSTVRNSDKVYFLGDLTFGRNRKPCSFWWSQLNGEKSFIRGNHDDNTVASISYDRFSAWDEKEKETKNFAVLHDPNELTDELLRWVEVNHAWVIHGDKHNNNLRAYPFISGDRRTINVSSEVIDYRPVGLAAILSLRLNTLKRMDTVRSAPVRI